MDSKGCAGCTEAKVTSTGRRCHHKDNSEPHFIGGYLDQRPDWCPLIPTLDADSEAAEMKENKAMISFPCGDVDGDCVYGRFTDDKFPKICELLGKNMQCQSAVARVNRMVVECKNLGFEIKGE